MRVCVLCVLGGCVTIPCVARLRGRGTGQTKARLRRFQGCPAFSLYLNTDSQSHIHNCNLWPGVSGALTPDVSGIKRSDGEATETLMNWNSTRVFASIISHLQGFSADSIYLNEW